MILILSERYCQKWSYVCAIQDIFDLFRRGILSNWIVPQIEIEKAKREVRGIQGVLQAIALQCCQNDGADKSLSHAFRE